MNEILNYIGLAKRANKIITGEDLIVSNIKSKKIKLLIISTECSENTLKKLTDKCKSYNVDYIVLFTTKELSTAIGKNNRVSIGITDKGFCEIIKKKLR